MYDFDVVKLAAKDFGWPDIIYGLTGTSLPPQHKNQGHPCPCPDGPGVDRFNYHNRRGDGDFHCRQCLDRQTGDGFRLIMKINRWSFPKTVRAVADFIKAPEAVQWKAPRKPAPAPAPEPEPEIDPDHEPRCKELWRAAREVVPGDPVWLYLRNRGILLTPDKASIRFHPGVYNWMTKTRHPAMIALVWRPGVERYTLQITFLTLDGRKAPIEPKWQRLFMVGGTMPNGCYVELSSVIGVVLGVAEGIETALSASQITGLDVWAPLCEGSLRKFTPPDGVTHLIIFADNDEGGAGLRAAEVLRDRLAESHPHVRVEIRMPDLNDWNDVLTSASMAAE